MWETVHTWVSRGDILGALRSRLKRMTTTERNMEEELKAVFLEITRRQLSGNTVKDAVLSERVMALMEWGMENHPRFNVKSDKVWSTIRTYIHCFKKEEVSQYTSSGDDISPKARLFLGLERALEAVTPLNNRLREKDQREYRGFAEKKDYLLKTVQTAWVDFCKRKKLKKYRKDDWVEAPLALIEEFANGFFTDDLVKYLEEGMSRGMNVLFHYLNKTHSYFANLIEGLHIMDNPRIAEAKSTQEALKYVFGEILHSKKPSPFLDRQILAV